MRELRDEFDLTVLLVEHHMAMVMAISEHIVVLDFGSKIAEGLPDDIRNNPRGHRGLPGDAGMTPARGRRAARRVRAGAGAATASTSPSTKARSS